MRLSNVDFLRLLPLFMRKDEANIGLSSGVNPVVRDVAARILLLSTWNRIDELPEADLDELAWELHIEWYSEAAPIETKRRLNKESDLVYARLGTRWAVEEVVASYLVISE